MFNKNQTTLICCPGGKAGSVAIPEGVTGIADGAFRYCTSLTGVTIPDSVTNIGEIAFWFCTGLTDITIGNSVTSIGGGAFAWGTNLTSVCFQGNVPGGGSDVFYRCDHATVYYLPGITGWGRDFGGRPTALWLLPYPVILSFPPAFGVLSNGFGFTTSWAANASVAVEACTDLHNPAWSPVGTHTLTDGWSYFSDPHWTNYPARFYRLRSP